MEVEAASWNMAGLVPPGLGQDRDRGDSPMPDLPPEDGLARVDSNESSMSAGFDSDVELHRVPARTDNAEDTTMTDAPAQPDAAHPQESLQPPSRPPTPPQDNADRPPPPPNNNDAEQKKAPEDDFHFVPIFEDTSPPGVDEIKRMESAGETSALDYKHWEARVFKDLEDPAFQPIATDRIEWTVERFNGTQDKPSKELLRYSDSVKIGDYHWRIKLYPKGNGTSHIGAYVECVEFVEKQKERKAEKKESDQDVEPAPKEHYTSEILDSPMPTIGKEHLRKPIQVPAQVMIMMYNPQEPRVHWHKKSNHAFTPADPDRGFSRVGSCPIYDLGLRAPESRQAMLRNDKLAFIAYVRLFKDPTGFLFVKEDSDYRRDFARTGLRPISTPADSRGYASNLASAVVAWSLMPAMRSMIYRASKYDVSKMPLTKALQEFLAHWRRQPPSEYDAPSVTPAQMKQIAQALHWHGSCQSSENCHDTTHIHGMAGISPDTAKVTKRKRWHPAGRGMQDFDIFQTWEFMLDTLDLEWRGTEMAGKLAPLFDPSGFRARLSPKSKDIQSSLFHQVMKKGQHVYPPMLQVELPRSTFDETKRKWLKTDDKIGISNGLKLSRDESGWYSLYALILHDGNLASRQYTPIVRPDGRNWYKVSMQRATRVTRLTEKQAMTENETRAYVAIYLRADMVHTPHINAADPFKGYPENDWEVPEYLQKEEKQPRFDQCNCPNCRADREEVDDEHDEEDKEVQEPVENVGENAGEDRAEARESTSTQQDPTPENNTTRASAEPDSQNEKQGDGVQVDELEKLESSSPEQATAMVTADEDGDEPMSEEVHELDYFTFGYYRGTLHKGYMHGKGRRIYRNGDVFDGDYQKDGRHGKGHQVYQNGDTYEGDWENDKPHGSGTKITAATGNIYQGGFAKGKHHGEFTLTGKKAETLKGCLICYEQDRDAVFYPCGHMCACLDCARKLEDCPYCHRSISESIRLYAI